MAQNNIAIKLKTIIDVSNIEKQIDNIMKKTHYLNVEIKEDVLNESIKKNLDKYINAKTSGGKKGGKSSLKTESDDIEQLYKERQKYTIELNKLEQKMYKNTEAFKQSSVENKYTSLKNDLMNQIDILNQEIESQEGNAESLTHLKVSERQSEIDALAQHEQRTLALAKAQTMQGVTMEDLKKKSKSLDGTYDTKINELEKLSKSYVDSGNGLSLYQAKLKETSSAIKTELKENAEAATKHSKSFTGTIQRTFRNFVAWLSSAGVLIAMKRAIKGIITYISDLDKVLTSAKIVRGYNEDQIQQLAQSYNELAQEMGATTLEVANATLEWLRQGNEMSQALELASNSLMLSKLSGIDASEATRYLTAVMKSFKIEVNDVTSVVDKLVAVDNAAATSAAELSEALSKTAVSASVAGVGIDKTLGYLGVISETSRMGAEEVGTGLRQMFARMGTIKMGALDETGIGLNDVERSLRLVGIQLRDTNGEFKNMGDILDQVGQNWENYTSIQQSAIAVALGGTRQREKMLILLENYDRALELSSISAESAGLAEARYGYYLNSVEGKLNTLKATYETFIQTLTLGKGSSVYKNILGLATGILKVVNATGGWIAIMPPAIKLFRMWNSQNAIGKGLTSLYAKTIGALTEKVEQLGKKFGMTTKVAKITTYALLALVATAINFGMKAIQDWNAKVSNMIQNAEALKDEIYSLQTEFDTLTEKYANGEATNIEKNRLNILNKLIEAQKLSLKLSLEQIYLEQYAYNKAKGEYIFKPSGDATKYKDMSFYSYADYDKLVNQLLDESITPDKYTEVDEARVELAGELADRYSELNIMKDAGVSLTEQDLEFMKEWVKRFGQVEDAADKVEWTDPATMLTQSEEQINLLKSLYSEMQKSGELASETVFSLLTNTNAWAEAIKELVSVNEDGKYIISLDGIEKKWNEVINSIKTNYKGLIKDELIAGNIEQAKFLENQLRIMENYSLMASIDEQKSALESALSTYKDYLTEWYDTEDARLNKYKDLLDENTDFITSLSEEDTSYLYELFNNSLDSVTKYEEIIARINELKVKNNWTDQESLDLQEAQLSVAKAEQALADAQADKSVRVYKEGVGWTYVEDAEAVKDAQEELVDAQKELNQAKFDKILKEYDKLIDKNNEEKEAMLDTLDVFKLNLNEYLKSLGITQTWEELSYKDRLEVVQTWAQGVSDEYDKVIAKQKALNSRGNAKSNYVEDVINDISNEDLENWILEKKQASARAAAQARKVKTTSSSTTKPSIPDNDAPSSNDNGNDNGLVWLDDLFGGSWQMMESNGYADGGVVATTGLQMLHGTVSSPEVILNDKQAANILYKMAQGVSFPSSNNSNDNSISVSNLVVNAPNNSTFESILKTAKAKLQTNKF